MTRSQSISIQPSLQVFALLFNVILPIKLGISIYALFRGLYFIDPKEIVFPIYPNVNSINWIKYNLVDGLWLYALLSALAIIWKGSKSRFIFIWMALAISVSLISEVLQARHVIPGTFDWNDLIAYTIVSSFFCISQYRNYSSLKK
ncbi:MAG: hypothetical protein R3D58_14900 [Saprospiraceae bacterium]